MPLVSSVLHEASMDWRELHPMSADETAVSEGIGLGCGQVGSG